MEVLIRDGGCDQGTAHIADAVRADFEAISKSLSRDFGAGLEHLWITVELIPGAADRRPPFPFRFQKIVKPSAGLLPKTVIERLNIPPAHNVGSLSVRPDYFELAKVPPEKLSSYLLQLAYESTAVLEKRQRTFPQFRA
jgi:hypothetical protein